MAATHHGVSDPSLQAGPSSIPSTATAVPLAATAVTEGEALVDENNPSSAEAMAAAASASMSGSGFFGSFRKKVREAAGIDSQFVNPYLGKAHPSARLPPYGPGQTSTSPSPISSGIPTSSVYPHPFVPQQQQWDDYYYQQQYPMMHPYANRMSMVNYPMNYYGGMPPPPHPPYSHSPYLYPSSSLLDYYGMNHPYYSMAGYLGAPPGYPFTASALPVQDKRLLPERNYFSAVKDIWHTNLQ